MSVSKKRVTSKTAKKEASGQKSKFGGKSFYLEGKGKGIVSRKEACLIIHGLTSSTQEVEDLALFLNAKGFSVIVPLLPGHNTYYKDLSKVKWKEWYSEVLKFYKKAKEKYGVVNVIGLSMGATLSALLASEKKINKLVLLAPAIQYVNKKTFLTPFINFFYRYQRKDYSKHFKHRKNSIADLYDDVEFHKRIAYDTASTHAIAESLKLINVVRRNLYKIERPTLIIHSVRDHTINHVSSKFIHDEINSKKKKLILLRKSGHIITCDVEKKTVFKEIFDFLKRRL